MAITPSASTTITAGSAAEFNTALQAALDALTITNVYGFSIHQQGGNIIGTLLYD
jgi:hypothetical protein